MIKKPDVLESRAAFHAEAVRRFVRMKEIGTGVSAVEVFDYLRKRVRGKPIARPRPRKIA